MLLLLLLQLQRPRMFSLLLTAPFSLQYLSVHLCRVLAMRAVSWKTNRAADQRKVGGAAGAQCAAHDGYFHATLSDGRV